MTVQVGSEKIDCLMHKQTKYQHASVSESVWQWDEAIKFFGPYLYDHRYAVVTDHAQEGLTVYQYIKNLRGPFTAHIYHISNLVVRPQINIMYHQCIIVPRWF